MKQPLTRGPPVEPVPATAVPGAASNLQLDASGSSCAVTGWQYGGLASCRIKLLLIGLTPSGWCVVGGLGWSLLIVAHVCGNCLRAWALFGHGCIAVGACL